MVERIRIVMADATAGSAPARSDRRATTIARALRDAGAEVVYTGAGQTPEQIVRTVVQEDADALVVVDDGAGDTVLRRTVGLLADIDNDAGDVAVFGVTSTPDSDVTESEATGLVTIFAPNATVGEIVARVRAELAAGGDG